jgi:histidine triad (HIT) family protein
VDGCLFCRIAAGEIPCHEVWRDEKHLAFLTIFPNTDGFTVVIPKKHYSSYAFDLPDAVLYELVLAARAVGKLLDARLNDVGRTGLVFEGFGVDHVHAKLFPMHGTRMPEWKPILKEMDRYFHTYEGYISTHDGPRVDDAKLAALAARIRGSTQ